MSTLKLGYICYYVWLNQSKKLGGKQRGTHPMHGLIAVGQRLNETIILCETLFTWSILQEWPSKNMAQWSIIKNALTWRANKRNYIVCKKRPKLFWKSFKAKGDLTLPFTLQEALDYYTNFRPHDKVSITILFQTLSFYMFLPKGNMGHHERFSKSQGMRYSWATTWASKIGCK